MVTTYSPDLGQVTKKKPFFTLMSRSMDVQKRTVGISRETESLSMSLLHTYLVSVT